MVLPLAAALAARPTGTTSYCTSRSTPTPCVVVDARGVSHTISLAASPTVLLRYNAESQRAHARAVPSWPFMLPAALAGRLVHPCRHQAGAAWLGAHLREGGAQAPGPLRRARRARRRLVPPTASGAGGAPEPRPTGTRCQPSRRHRSPFAGRRLRGARRGADRPVREPPLVGVPRVRTRSGTERE